MKCPEHKEDMVFVGRVVRGVYAHNITMNWYCEKCNIIYVKDFVEEVAIEEEGGDESQ